MNTSFTRTSISWGISLLLSHMVQSIHSRPCTEPESTARDRWPEWVVCLHGIARGWTVYMFHPSSLFCHLTLCLVSSWSLWRGQRLIWSHITSCQLDHGVTHVNRSLWARWLHSYLWLFLCLWVKNSYISLRSAAWANLVSSVKDGRVRSSDHVYQSS